MSERDRSEHRPPPHGTMVAEAVQLADAARLWLAARGAGARGPAGGDDVWSEATTDPGGPPTSCRDCPVCRAKAVLSGVRPEVYEHLAEAVSAVAAALRAVERARRS